MVMENDHASQENLEPREPTVEDLAYLRSYFEARGERLPLP
jgi:hypothetical protein